MRRDERYCSFCGNQSPPRVKSNIGTPRVRWNDPLYRFSAVLDLTPLPAEIHPNLWPAHRLLVLRGMHLVYEPRKNAPDPE